MTELKIVMDNYGLLYVILPDGSKRVIRADIFGSPYYGIVRVGEEPPEELDDCPLVEVPSADVRPVVHGEWVDGGVDGDGACGIEYRYNKCSVCGYEYSFPMKYNFCPNCGADMRPDGGA